jgi:peptidoglycan/LPS O-acetylase OafA/YrhL
MNSEALNYRPDIDGLRGWAVAFVILFHLDIATFGGGYTGVDIFFVISGFLITRIIKNDYSAKQFSFSRFYIRRARRLFPALFFTLLFSFLVGATLFAPEHFAKLSQSTVTVLLFGSNIYFWLNSGYFDLTATEQPLLHT